MSLRDLPPLSQLRAFAALAEAGSMSDAGAALNVSHAAVSQQVRALEARLGVRLAERDGRGVALTAEGRRLAAVLTDAFGAMGREVDALTGADAGRPLQITTTPMFAASWLVPRIAEFRHKHPDIDLMLNPGVEAVVLEPGGVDVAIRYGDGTWPGLDAELLVRAKFGIAAARSLVDGRAVSCAEDLLDLPWLQELGGNEAKLWLARQGITTRPTRGLTQMPGNLLLDGLRSGQGLVVTPRIFIEADIARGDVVMMFEDDTDTLGYFIVTRPGVLRPPARSFRAWLRSAARN